MATPSGVGEPDHLTPGRTVVAMDQMHALFAPLATVSDSGKLLYVQARSVTSRDSRHWTIRLRKGWTFHNGEPVTARSYADSATGPSRAARLYNDAQKRILRDFPTIPLFYL